MTKAKHLFLYLMAVMLAVGVAGCKKESEQVKEPEPQDKPTPGPEKPDDGKTDKPFGDLPESVHIFEQVVPVDNSKVKNLVCDTTLGSYSITYLDEVPEIKPGNVVVVNDGGNPLIVLVFESETSGNTVSFKGPLGDLSYVFYDTEFVLASSPSVVDDNGMAVYTPVDNDGSSLSKRVVDEKTYGLIDGIEFSTKIDVKKWDNLKLKGSLKCKPSLDFKVITRFSQRSIVHLMPHKVNEYEISYGPGSVDQSYWVFNKAEKTDYDYIFVGKANWESDLTLEYTDPKSIELKLKDIMLKEDLFWYGFDFFVGPVLVQITVGADIFFGGKFDLSSKVSTTLYNNASLNIDLGARRIEKDENEYEHTLEPIFNTELKQGEKPDKCSSWNVNEKGKFSVEVSPSLVLHANLYTKRCFGVAVAVKPYIEASATVSAFANIFNNKDSYTYEGLHLTDFNKNWKWFDNDAIGWATSAKAEIGLAMELGWYREKLFFEKEKNRFVPFEVGGVELNIELMKKKLVLAEGPVALVASSIESKSQKLVYEKDYFCDDKFNTIIDFPIKKGEPITINYKLLGGLLNNTELVQSLAPAEVYLRSKYGSATSKLWLEESKFVWTPMSNDDYLEAFILDCDGRRKSTFRIGLNGPDEYGDATFIDESIVDVIEHGYPCIEAIGNTIVDVYNNESVDLWYFSTRDMEWQQVAQSFVLAPGEKLFLRGANSNGINSVDKRNLNIKITGNASLSGDINNLLSYNMSFETLPCEGCFRGLFEGSTGLVSAENFVLPSTGLTRYCYAEMFKGCVNLKTSPLLSAKELVGYCCKGMYEGCSSLSSVKVEFESWRDKYYKNEYPSYGQGTNIGIGNDNPFVLEETPTENWLLGVAPTGNFICPESLETKIGDSYIPKGWTINGKKKDPVTYSNLKLSGGNVVQDELLELSCVFSAPCHVGVYVDGKLVKPVSLSLVYSIELPTSVAGNHECRFVATNGGETIVEKSFSYTVLPKNVTSSSSAGFGDSFSDDGKTESESVGNSGIGDKFQNDGVIPSDSSLPNDFADGFHDDGVVLPTASGSGGNASSNFDEQLHDDGKL